MGSTASNCHRMFRNVDASCLIYRELRGPGARTGAWLMLGVQTCTDLSHRSWGGLEMYEEDRT